VHSSPLLLNFSLSTHFEFLKESGILEGVILDILSLEANYSKAKIEEVN